MSRPVMSVLIGGASLLLLSGCNMTQVAADSTVSVIAGTGHVESLGPDGPLLMTSDVRFDGDPKNSIAAWISRDGGWAWDFAGLVARGGGEGDEDVGGMPEKGRWQRARDQS